LIELLAQTQSTRAMIDILRPKQTPTDARPNAMLLASVINYSAGGLSIV
jgi:hypothetical protein